MDRIKLGAGGLATLVALWARPLVAAGGGGGGEGGAAGGLEVILLLVAVVGLAYLVAHLLLERLAERFGVISGIEYVILGALIFRLIIVPIFPPGPDQTSTEVVHTILTRLRPVLILGTGLLGLMVGLNFDRANMPDEPGLFALPALMISATTFGAVVLVPALVLSYTHSFEFVRQIMPALVCAGAVATVASDGPIRSLVAFLGASGRATTIAVRTAQACSAVAITLFGSIYTYDHVSPVLPGGQFEWLEWLGIYVLVGTALGVIFGIFLRRDFSDDKILTILIGIAVFSSGIADALNLSPIFLNFILGVFLINTSRHGDHVREMLKSIEHPLYIVLFLFAGAELNFAVPYWAYGLAIPYLALRLAGRWLGGFVTPQVHDKPAQLPPLGRILLAPGALSIAMALDFLTIYREREIAGAGPFFGTSHDVSIVYTGLITAIIISEVLAYLTARSWLIDAADVSPTESSGSESAHQDGSPHSREVG